MSSRLFRRLVGPAAVIALAIAPLPAQAVSPDDRAGLTGMPAPFAPVAVMAEPDTVECVAGGATAGDGSAAVQLNGLLTGKMRNAMTAYRTSCARAVIDVVRARNMDRRAAVIAITTVIVETSIRNVNYGDLDSLGLFQQRATWGSAAQRLDPVYATNAFLNTMIQFYPGNSWMSGVIGDICQAVQRSAFPARYQPEAADAARIVDLLWNGRSAGEASGALVFNGELTFFGLGIDNRLDHWWFNPAVNVTQRDSWGNGIAGRPVAVVFNNELTVFARGTDGSLQHWWLRPGQAAQRDSWGDGVAGDPTVVVHNNELTVFARGVDGTLEHWWLRPGQANQRDSWGDGVAGDPSAISFNGELTVFARGTDDSLQHWWLRSGQANQRDSWGGGVAGDPTTTIFNNELTVFARGTGGSLEHWWLRPGQANQRDSWGDGVAGDPSAISFNGELTVFARGTDNSLQHWWLQPGQVNRRDSWGSDVAGDPHTTIFNGELTVFARGTDNSLQHWWLRAGQANQRDSWGGEFVG